MSYGIIFWGKSSHSSVIFKMQIRIMGCGCRKSCRELFKELKILPLSSQYIFSLLLLTVNNKDYFVFLRTTAQSEHKIDAWWFVLFFDWQFIWWNCRIRSSQQQRRWGFMPCGMARHVCMSTTPTLLRWVNLILRATL
jgi:hypothetical protein